MESKKGGKRGARCLCVAMLVGIQESVYNKARKSGPVVLD
jgi:hypothetical protein